MFGFLIIQDFFVCLNLYLVLGNVFARTGGDVNLINDGGRTALHYAASKGWLKVAEVLISHGAKINKKDKVYTVLHNYVSQFLFQLFLLHAKFFSLVYAYFCCWCFKVHLLQVGCTPLHRAASTGKSELCELLIEEGADVDVVDKAGQTPLVHAVICQNQQVTEIRTQPCYFSFY